MNLDLLRVEYFFFQIQTIEHILRTCLAFVNDNFETFVFGFFSVFSSIIVQFIITKIKIGMYMVYAYLNLHVDTKLLNQIWNSNNMD